MASAHRPRIAGLLTLLFLLSCHPAKTSHINGYVSNEDDRWAGTTLSVCFLQPGYEVDKANIQAAVTREYARAGITFEGWGPCQSEHPATLQVEFMDEESFSFTNSFGKRNEVFLDSSNVHLGLLHRCGVTYRGSLCEANVALHEFGHAVGLHHEMNRRDNPTCDENQFNKGSGEYNALQVGDFDAASVMNYCTLYGANDRLEALTLSGGDVKAIRGLYAEPTAWLVDPPEGFNPANYQIRGDVGGIDVATFRYQVGPSTQVDCKNPDLYSAPVPQATGIGSSVLNTQPTNTFLRLCLLAISADGRQQSIDRYSSVDFARMVPADLPTPEVVRMELKPFTDPAFLQLEVEMKDPLPGISAGASLGYQGKPDLSSNSQMNAWVQSADGKTIHILFPQKALVFNGEAYVKGVSFYADGKSLVLKADENDATMQGTSLPVPHYTLMDRFDRLTQAPKIVSVTRVADDDFMRLQIVTEENLGITSAKAGFLNKATGERAEVSASEIYRQSGNTTIGAFSLPKGPHNGVYTLDTLTINDVFADRWTLDHLADNPDSPVHVETRVPTLLNLEYPQEITLATGVPSRIRIRLQTAAPVKYLSVVFTKVGDAFQSLNFERISGPSVDGTYELECKPGSFTQPGDYALYQITTPFSPWQSLKADLALIPDTNIPLPRIKVLAAGR